MFTKRLFFLSYGNKLKSHPPQSKGNNTIGLSKFDPISLLCLGTKVLEKWLVTTINDYLFPKTLLWKNQFIFMPQTCTVDAIVAVMGSLRTI